jgi:hypothetical protein
MSLSEDEELELLELEEAEYQATLPKPKPEGPSLMSRIGKALISGRDEDLPEEFSGVREASEDFGRGLVQGGSLGFSDEIAGALEAPLGATKSIANKFGGEFDDTAYRAARDESRMLDAQASERSPGAFTSGQVAGGVASAFVPGLNVAKGAKLAGAAIPKIAGTALADLAGTALISGGQGLAAGVGSSTGENVGELARDAAIGTGVGALGGAAGYGLNKAIGAGFQGVKNFAGKASDNLSDYAENLALKATGATGREAQKFQQGAGRELLDRGLVNFGDDAEKIAERIVGANDEAQAAISSSLKRLDAQGVTANVNSIVDDLQSQVAKLKSDPSQAGVVAKLQKTIDNILETGEGSIPLQSAEQTKRGFNKAAGNWMDPEAGAAGKAAYRAYRDEVEKAALNASPELGSVFKEGKKTYGLLKPIQDAAQRRAATLNQSPIGGLLDTTAAIAGEASTGGAGIAAAMARRGIAPRLASSGAITADYLSEVAKKAPDLMGKFGPVFQGAAQRGTQAVASTHFILENTNEEYRKLLKELRGEGSE